MFHLLSARQNTTRLIADLGQIWIQMKFIAGNDFLKIYWQPIGAESFLMGLQRS